MKNPDQASITRRGLVAGAAMTAAASPLCVSNAEPVPHTGFAANPGTQAMSKISSA